MEQTVTLADVADNPMPERAGWIKWLPPLVLLVLVSVLVGVAVLSRQPLSIWNTADIALFVLAALLCTFVAVSLALAGCSDWLRRMEQSGQTMVAQLLVLQDTQSRLCQVIEKPGPGSNARAAQGEKQQQLMQDSITQLTGGLRTVASNMAALGQELHVQSEAVRATLATVTSDLQQLRGLTQTVVGVLTGDAQGRAAANHSLQEALTVATAALQEGQKTLERQVEKVAENDRQMNAAVTALTASYGQLLKDVGSPPKSTRLAVKGVSDVARERTAAGAKDSARMRSPDSLGGKRRRSTSGKVRTGGASARRTRALPIASCTSPLVPAATGRGRGRRQRPIRGRAKPSGYP